MRYDTPVYFQRITPGEYDSNTGNYTDDVTEETVRYASVMDTGTKMLHLVYGRMQQNSLTIQIQRHYIEVFDHIRVGNTVYQVDYARELKRKQTFIVSEVP